MNEGAKEFLKALGIVFTMISLRAALKSLQSNTSVFETQTNILRRIEQRLSQIQDLESSNDSHIW